MERAEAQRRFLLGTGLVAMIGIGTAFSAHQYYELNVSPLLDQAARDANAESPAVPQDELSQAFRERNNYLQQLGLMRTGRVSDNFAESLAVPFDPNYARELSSRPEVLQARETLNQQYNYESSLERIKKERGLDVSGYVTTSVQNVGESLVLMSVFFSAIIGAAMHMNRKDEQARLIITRPR